MKSVLIVEDDYISRIAYELCLKDNFDVVLEPDPDKVKELYQQRKFDVVLMDINLGLQAVNGGELMQELKQSSPENQTVFVAVTAYAMPRDEKRFRDMGFNGFLSKPVNYSALAQYLQHVTG